MLRARKQRTYRGQQDGCGSNLDFQILHQNDHDNAGDGEANDQNVRGFHTAYAAKPVGDGTVARTVIQR